MPCRLASNPPPARMLVVLGTVDLLTLKDRTIRFSGAEWLLLAPSGAEKASAGRSYLMMVPNRLGDEAGRPTETARRTFRTWTDRDPKETVVRDLPDLAECNRRVGEVESIIYSSDKWTRGGIGHRYWHDFGTKHLPSLSECKRKGVTVAYALTGGAWRLTRRGIVG